MDVFQIKDTATRMAVQGLLQRIQAMETQGPKLSGLLDANGQRLTNVGDPQAAQDAVTLAYGTAHYGGAAMQQALSVAGETPLTVTGLHGLLADPQTAGLQVLGANDPLPPIQRALSGQLVARRGQIYYFDTTIASPGRWVALTLPFYGTLSPDTKPGTLTASDDGFLFFATDYNRMYRWTNVAGTYMWLDAPGAPARWEVALFNHPPEPLAGWVVCDGSVTTRSTLNGGTTPVVAPDLITNMRFLRGGGLGDAGTTGGADTHTHNVEIGTFSSDINNLTEEVQSGTGTIVARNGHIHGVEPPVTVTTPALHWPPYWVGIPYMRV